MKRITTARNIYNALNLGELNFKNSGDIISKLQKILQAEAVEMDQDYGKERCWYIFEDGSAIGIDSDDDVYIKTNYGRNVYHQSL